MTVVYEVYQGISEYYVMIVLAQVPACPLPMEGPRLSILRQCVFEALFERDRMSAAFYYEPQTGFLHVYQTVCIPLVRQQFSLRGRILP